MKSSAILSIIFGLCLIAIAIGIFVSLPTAKDDADVAFFLLMSAFAGFGGVCFVINGISNLIKYYKDEKDN